MIGARKMTAALAAMLIAGGISAASAQVRDVQRPAVGSASISGLVITDSSSPRPVRRVTLTLTETSSGRPPVSAITDDSGAFAFRDLAPGTYTLVAMRAAWVPSAYGAKTYGRGSGVPISLAAGQTIKDISLKMIRGGVIAGTVRDAQGRPAANSELILLTSRSDGGRRRMAAIAQSAQTNSRGEYRIFGLPPGDYVVRAQPPRAFGQADLRPVTAAELDWSKRAATGAPEPPPPAGRPVAYSASYYPGTVDVSTASPVTVGPGEERQGIDFVIQLVPTSSISGRASGPDGQPPRNASASLQILSNSAASIIDAMVGVASSGSMGIGGSGVRVGADGRFSTSGVPPGRYRLTIRGAASDAPARPGAPDSELAGFAMAMMPGLAGMSGATLVATEEFVVSGQDVADLDLRLQPGLAMSGTVVFEGDDPKSPVKPERSMIALHNSEREISSALEMVFGAMLGAHPGAVTKEGTFTVSGLTPARYRIVASPPGAVNPFGAAGMISADGWVLKSAMWNGRDLADGSFEIQPGVPLGDVVVSFTKAVTEISGRLLDAAGKPTSGFPIVVFSTKPADWAGGSRRVVSAKPASDGTYKIRGLPPGEYYVCALGDLDMNDLYDRQFLEQLAAASSRINLGDGEKKTQDLKLGGGH